MVYRRKGASTIVATVILVVFVMGLSAMVLTWIQESTKESMLQADDQRADILDCSGGNVKIDSVYISNNSGVYNSTIVVIIDNNGRAPFKLEEVTLWNTTGSYCTLDTSQTSLSSGDTISLLNNSCSVLDAINCSGFYKIKVTTNCVGVSSELTNLNDVICNGVVLG
ncbi:MAG: hypothetical protein K0B02_00920 [DPANN group archaeon]|nr:hypothetical protein [DPANN group archaeon]